MFGLISRYVVYDRKIYYMDEPFPMQIGWKMFKDIIKDNLNDGTPFIVKPATKPDIKRIKLDA